MKINETDIGDGDDSEDGVEFDEAAAASCIMWRILRGNRRFCGVWSVLRPLTLSAFRVAVQRAENFCKHGVSWHV